MIKTIGRYEIKETIGEGAVSTVYKAYDPGVNRYVAIKVLREEYNLNFETLHHFLRDTKSVGKLIHPNIVTIYSVGEVDGRPYIAMELLSGQFLDDALIASGHFSWEDVVNVGMQLASALDYAHKKGVIHSDIKPGNIAWSADEKRIVLTDFGETFHTKFSEGTTIKMDQAQEAPRYMSPEQILGKAVDARSDLFSIGVILYQLLTGHRPFNADNITELTEQITGHRPESIATYVSGLRQPFIEIIEKLLEKSPERRFQTCAELYKELDDLSQNLSIAKAEKMGTRRRWVFSGVVVAVSLAVIIFVGVFKKRDKPLPVVEPVVSKTVIKPDGDPDEPQVPSHQALVANINRQLTQFECASLTATLDQTSNVAVSGHISHEDDMLALMDVMDRVQRAMSVSYEINIMAWPYCEIATVLSSEKNSNVSHSRGLRFNTSTHTAELSQGDYLVLNVYTPDYDAYIYIDYYRSNGTVVHLVPKTKTAATLTPASSSFLSSDEDNSWKIKKPYGENMIVVMASYNPLIPIRQAQVEPAEDYLALLHRQIVVNRHELSAEYAMVQTGPQ